MHKKLELILVENRTTVKYRTTGDFVVGHFQVFFVTTHSLSPFSLLSLPLAEMS